MENLVEILEDMASAASVSHFGGMERNLELLSVHFPNEYKRFFRTVRAIREKPADKRLWKLLERIATERAELVKSRQMKEGRMAMKITKNQLEKLIENTVKEQTRGRRGREPWYDADPRPRRRVAGARETIVRDLETAQDTLDTVYGKLLSAYSKHEETEELEPNTARQLNNVLYLAGELQQKLKMLNKKVVW